MIHPRAIILLAMLTASMASESSVVEDKPRVIDVSHAPVAPPESAEVRMALRQHREVSILNRFIFQGNVLQGTGDLVDHWIVMFCPSWHDKCQSLLPSFELLGVQWENKLNKDVMRSSVRFAKVDCATEKALCVSLDVDDYPSVVHYHNQQRVATWNSGAPGLVRFVKQELEGSKAKRRPRRTPAQPAAKATSQTSCGADADGATATDRSHEVEDGHRLLAVLLLWMQFVGSPWRTLCFVLMLIAGAHGALQFALQVARTRARKDSKGSTRSLVPGEQQHAAHPEGLQACLPQEWAHERRSIEL